MNRKSLYCCPIVLAALVVATGGAASVQAQEAPQPQAEVTALDTAVSEPDERLAEIAVEVPAVEAAPMLELQPEVAVGQLEPEIVAVEPVMAEPVMAEPAAESVATLPVAIVTVPSPAAASAVAEPEFADSEPTALKSAVPEPVAPEPTAELAAPEPAALAEEAAGEAIAQRTIIEASDWSEPAIAPSPIPAWSSDAEVSPALAELVAGGAIAATPSSTTAEIEAEVAAALPAVSTQEVSAETAAIPVFTPSSTPSTALQRLAQAPVPSEDELLVQTPDLGQEDGLPTDPAPVPPEAELEAVPDAPVEAAEEPQVLVGEVQVSGVEGSPEEEKLLNAVYDAVQTRPGRPTTSSQLQEDLNAIFATGYFENVNFRPEDTPLGVRVRFLVEPNPVLRQVVAPDTQVLPAEVVEEAFSPQYGQTLNFNDLQDGVKRVNTWYQDNGYVLAQVVDATQVSEDGTVNLQIAEGIVDSLKVQFLDADGNATTEEGELVRGRTKPYIVTREFSLKPGDVFSRDEVEKSSQRVFGLGIFEDVRLSLDPSPDDPRKVVVVVNVIEARTGSIGASGGVSSASGLFGSFSVGQENFRGRNQKLRTEVTLGQRDFLFDVGFTDPWIKGDPYRTSYTVNAFRRRSVSLIYSGGERDVDLPNGDTPRILRLGGGIRFSRPLSKSVFEPSVWSASAGLQYQRISIRDQDGDNENQDQFGNDLTFSGDDTDDLVLLQLGAARDRRNDRLQPTQGSITRFNLDQSVPIGSGSILMNRFRVNHSHFFPVNFLRLTEGCKQSGSNPTDCPQTLAFNIQAGNIFGDLPPYEAFSIGGSNSVRGYGEGEVGSGRRFLQATAEYRFPVFSFVGGALFADFGTDLGSGDDVPGDPAGIRRKPGSGYGVGLGVRVQSPLGPIRADYTVLTDDGDSRFQFGIGQRF